MERRPEYRDLQCTLKLKLDAEAQEWLDYKRDKDNELVMKDSQSIRHPGSEAEIAAWRNIVRHSLKLDKFEMEIKTIKLVSYDSEGDKCRTVCIYSTDPEIIADFSRAEIIERLDKDEASAADFLINLHAVVRPEYEATEVNKAAAYVSRNPEGNIKSRAEDKLTAACREPSVSVSSDEESEDEPFPGNSAAKRADN
ncbi:hypothetical protein LTR37_012985 [Vermiconidia calcicola]|uniref:Uncharacterized protein n=1 Tax=Vermiconidia calcicola TaxID=1690605 RepID=A0ACC3MXS3_9PEZI|nr:hypothetical protein LTR37_012985 [Vermiconidia calcicola]